MPFETWFRLPVTMLGGLILWEVLAQRGNAYLQRRNSGVITGHSHLEPQNIVHDHCPVGPTAYAVSGSFYRLNLRKPGDAQAHFILPPASLQADHPNWAAWICFLPLRVLLKQRGWQALLAVHSNADVAARDQMCQPDPTRISGIG